LYKTKWADERKISKIFGGSSCPQDDDGGIAEGTDQAAEPHFQRAEDSAFHPGAPKTRRSLCRCDYFCDKVSV
jgi:hypothetical protein